MNQFHHCVAAVFRKPPQFRGKSHLGTALGNFLIRDKSDESCITTITMRDSSLIRLDVRSRTERWAYWTGEYDRSTLLKLTKLLTPGSVVLDVGANIGFYSIPLGLKLKQIGGSLHAFEPIPTNFRHLEHSIELNNLQDYVTAHQIALGNEEREIEFLVEITKNSCTGNAVMVMGDVIPDSSKIAVASVKTLDSFIKTIKIKTCQMIKVDIEGAELMFLQGGANFIAKHRPIIYGEFNSYWMKQFGCSFVDVANLVAPWGYRFFKEHRGAVFKEFHEPTPDIQDILLVPNDASEHVWKILGVKF